MNREPAHAAAICVPTLTKGVEAVKAKSKARNEMIETVHGESCSPPVVGSLFDHHSIRAIELIDDPIGRRLC